MTTTRQRAYLEAMGIPVWLARADGSGPDPASSPNGRVQLGPGDGRVLLLCGSIAEPAGPLAADVARALGAGPVWAWPASEDGQGLAEAIGEARFTQVLVFGAEAERGLFGGPAPERVGSAAVLRVPSLEELAGSAGARQSLWRAITTHRLVQQDALGRQAPDA